MAAVDDEKPDTSVPLPPQPSESRPIVVAAVAAVAATPLSAVPPNFKDYLASVAYNVASQPLQNIDPRAWGVLTAISSNARKRKQVDPQKTPFLFK